MYVSICSPKEMPDCTERSWIISTVQLPTKSKLPARACVYLTLYGAVMISYPRPKAVAVPADYHGNQAVLTGAWVVVALAAWQGDEVVSRGVVTMSAMIMRPASSWMDEEDERGENEEREREREREKGWRCVEDTPRMPQEIISPPGHGLG